MHTHRTISALACVFMTALATSALADGTDLMPSFQNAADCYDVPLDLLLVIGEMGSRFEDRGTAPTIEGGYGVMALRANDLGGNSLAEAATLLEIDIEQLKANATANITGAAGVLDLYAREAGITRNGLEDWLPVILRYAGLGQQCDRIFARGFYERLQQGFSLTNSQGESFTVLSHQLTFDPASITSTRVVMSPPDYPGAIWDPTSCNHSNTNHSKDTVVCHTIEGTAAGAISMMKNNCTKNVSSHYVVSETGTVWQLVPEIETAWHATVYNSRAVGIEHEGYAASPTHPEPLYVGTGNLIRDICNRWGIPKEKRRVGPGIVSHVDVTECVQDGTHTDPGRGWNYDHLIALINQVSDPFVFTVESGAGGLNNDHYSENGAFSSSTGKTTVYGTTGGINTRYAYAGPQAVYHFTPSTSGRYKAYVTWPNSSNPTTAAQHVITHVGGTTTVVMDQTNTSNPCGRNNWNLLGEFTMNAGTEYTITQSTQSALVRADAVRWVFVQSLSGPPTITQDPTDQVINWGQTTTFTVAATGDGPLSYQWQKGAVNLSNGGHYSGVDTATLTISTANDSDANSYRCLVSNPYGSTPSNSATLTVEGSPGRMDADTDVDQTDFGLFQACLSGSNIAQNNPDCQKARMDAGSDVDQYDMATFLGCLSGPGVPAEVTCAGG